MQKALTRMNLHLHKVLSSVAGVAGMNIVRAIIAGERDPKRLALMREPGVKNTSEVIAKALEGDYRQGRLFALKQAVELCDFYHRQRDGTLKAITATAHKLARIFYRMWTTGQSYIDLGKDYYENRYKERVLRNIAKRARELGYDAVMAQPQK
jgi:hypothetical protein